MEFKFNDSNAHKVPEHLAEGFADVEWEKLLSSVLIEVKRGDEIFTSSAVAISRNTLLTCAHSVEGIEGGRVFWDPQYRPESKKFIKFRRVTLHPGYDQNKSNFKHDLAIISLRASLPSRIRPAKIVPTVSSVKEGMQAHRLGFGEREGANIRTWTNPDVLFYEPKDQVFKMRDMNGKIGDSGGPLFLKDESGYRLFGLHSTKEGEDLSYCVSVPDHIDWIRDKMGLRSLDL